MAKIDNLPGITLYKNDKFIDHRGELMTLWKNEDLPDLYFNHDKMSKSYKNVLRGLHTDKSWKLITCIFGKIQLVIVDFIKESPNYLNWTDFILDSNCNELMSVLVPPGFLNGHLVLSDEAIFHYKWCYEGEYPDVSSQTSVLWKDQKIGIKWLDDNPILSERDKTTPSL